MNYKHLLMIWMIRHFYTNSKPTFNPITVMFKYHVKSLKLPSSRLESQEERSGNFALLFFLVSGKSWKVTGPLMSAIGKCEIVEVPHYNHLSDHSSHIGVFPVLLKTLFRNYHANVRPTRLKWLNLLSPT